MRPVAPAVEARTKNANLEHGKGAMSALVFHHRVQTFRGTGAVRRFTCAPRECPVCGQHMEPRPLVAHSTSPDDLLVDFVFQCSRVNCRRMFVAEYAHEAGNTFELQAVAAPQFHEHAAMAGFH
jgi:hypothetical protein